MLNMYSGKNNDICMIEIEIKGKKTEKKEKTN